MGHPAPALTLDTSNRSADNKYRTAYPHGNWPGDVGNASGAGTAQSASSPGGSAVGAAGASGAGASRTPSAPTATATGGGGPSNDPLITWVAPTQNTDNSSLTNLDQYFVYRSQTNDFATAVRVNKVLATDTSYTDSGHPSGATYYWITAVNTDGSESDPSPVVSRNF